MRVDLLMFIFAHRCSVFVWANPCQWEQNVAFEKMTCLSCNANEVIPCGACRFENKVGNPGAGLQVQGLQGISVSAPWSSLLPPSSQPLGFRFAMDVQAAEISLFGSPVNSTLIVEFVDSDDADVDQGYVSVFHVLGQIPGPYGKDWRTVTAEVTDLNSSQLPKGWQGSGEFHPETHQPQLPANRTFASVLAGADEVRLTTFVPGMVYHVDIVYNLRMDNVVWTFDVPCNGDADLGVRIAGISALTSASVAYLLWAML